MAILNKEGAIVKGYALAAEHKNGIYNTINGDNLCESIISDIRDYKKLEDEILEFQPDFIFHLAAQSLVRTSYESPSETFEINVLGTSYLLASLRKLNKNVLQLLLPLIRFMKIMKRELPIRKMTDWVDSIHIVQVKLAQN